MSKHNEKPIHQGEGVKLVGSPAGLTDLLIKDNDLSIWAMEHIVNEGPKHKQVLTALLLKRLHALTSWKEGWSGKKRMIWIMNYLPLERLDLLH